jgi:hypothetical protein
MLFVIGAMLTGAPPSIAGSASIGTASVVEI